MKRSEMINKYQLVKITLDDGEIIYFGGNAYLFKGESRVITDITFTEPSSLPDGYCLDTFLHKINKEGVVNNGK